MAQKKKARTKHNISSKKYDEAQKLTGYTRKRLYDAAYLGGRVPSSSRNANLSVTHHRVVAPLPRSEQKEWLDRAEKEGMTVKALRRAIEDSNSLTSKTPLQRATKEFRSLADKHRKVKGLEAVIKAVDAL